MKQRIPRRVIAGVIAALVLAGVIVAALLPQAKPVPPLPPTQAHYLALASRGIAQTSRWWDGKRDWYVAELNDHDRFKLAKLWDTNGLFEALDEIAIAHPTSQNLAAVTAFANGSERYWNPNLKPVGGYAPYLGDRSPHQQTWYDDNGWIGIAFLDAYRATHNSRYVSDAERAFNFIAAGGWDKHAGGGMWWSTAHPWRSGEALAADADLAVRLYQVTRRQKYLTAAEQYIGWADKHLLQPHGGTYIPVANTPYPHLIEPKGPSGSSTPTASFSHQPSGRPRLVHIGNKVFIRCAKGYHICKAGALIPVTVNGHGPGAVAQLGRPGHGPPRAANAKPTMVAMPHDGEGAMLSAITTLCELTGKQPWCHAAEKLAGNEIVWLAPFADGPQYDSVLVRGLLTLYAHDHNPRWYRFAVAIAGLITTHARTGKGMYLRGWDGRPVPSATPGLLRTDAGSIDVFADLSTVAPPRGR